MKNILYPQLPLRALPRLLLLALVGAVIAGVYGIVHDQITYSLAPEYFTKFKFEQFAYADPGRGDIERLRESGTFEAEDTGEGLVSVFGSFLGECIVRCFGGSWTQQNGLWCVDFGEGNAAFPFAKVSKQMRNGLEDGIGGFFRTIPVIFADRERLISPEELL